MPYFDLHILIAAIAALAALTAPGALIAAATGAYRVAPGALLPALAVSLSLAVWALAVLPVLATRFPFSAAVGGVAVTTVAAGAFSFRAATSGGRPAAAMARRLKAVPAELWVLSACVAGAAWVIGPDLGSDGDTFFHMGLATRLAELGDPGFADIVQVPGGDPHPGYLVPAVHAAAAAAQTATGLAMPWIQWAMPIVLAPIMVLSWAALAVRVTGHRAAGPLSGAALVCGSVLATSPEFTGIAYAAQPRTIVSSILMVLLIALVLDPPDQGRKRDLATTAVVAAGIAAVHNTYVVWAGLWLLAALAARWVSPTPLRADRFLHTLAAATVGLAVPVAAMLPMVHGLRGADSRLAPTGLDYANRADQVVGAGWLTTVNPLVVVGSGIAAVALLGLVALPGRRPGTAQRWAGIATGLGILASLPPAQAAIATAISPVQAVRVSLTIPWSVGAAAGLLWACVHAERRGWLRTRWAIPATTATLALTTATASAAWEGERSAKVLAAAALAAVAVAVTKALAPRQRSLSSASGTVSDEPDGLVRPIIQAAMVGMLAAGAWWAVAHAESREFTHRAPTPWRVGGLRPIDGPVSTALRELPPGSVIVADPGLGYRVSGMVPVYTYASTHLFDSQRNHVDERTDLVMRLLAPGTPDSERVALADVAEADAILAATGPDAHVISAFPDWTEYTGRRYTLLVRPGARNAGPLTSGHRVYTRSS